ncbi:MAG TPA: sterol desaturase family protein [Nevskiaceae bacterium]|nr:sterol desaturase family protein [Nevskiaceae bacterium]
MTDTIVQVAAVLGLYIALELALGRFPLRVSARNNLLDLAAFANATFLVGPLIVYGSALIERHLLPQYAGLWRAWPWWLQLAVLLLCEDHVQYWYHRATHRFAWMWPAHKFHHSPEYMGVRIIWRNGFFYDLLMPNIWIAGVLVYLGFGQVYFWYYLVKLVITMGAHSELRWDEPLYRHRWLHPLAWIVERTISTPATHFAHHAYSEDDGIGHYNGNFGNLLFFWDVLYGTARITRRYPPRFGVPDDAQSGPDPWQVYLFYPLFRRRPRG